MPVELDSHHVVNLTLVPIRGRPNVGNGIDRADRFRYPQFQTQVNGKGHRVKLVNNFKPWLIAEIVDTGNVDQVIERKIVAAESCDFAQIGAAIVKVVSPRNSALAEFWTGIIR